MTRTRRNRPAQLDPLLSSQYRWLARALLHTRRLYSKTISHLGCWIDYNEPEIRLLKIHPGSYSDPISCTLNRASLRGRHHFKALSYVWGQSEFTRTVKINGYLFEITTNLYDALIHLRSPVEPLVIWVDAVCINQCDLRERNHQVSQMAMIYSAADEVVAWLGAAANSSEMAMSFIASYTGSEEDISKLRAPDSELWLALDQIWARPYWERVWVVQELASASKASFQCGSSIVTLERLQRVLVGLRDAFLFHSNDAIWKPRRMLRLRTGATNMQLLELLWIAAELKATDSRDRIYGLLGITPEEYRSYIVPDYSKTFGDIIQEVMEHYVRLEVNLDMLCYFTTFRDPIQSLPSW